MPPKEDSQKGSGSGRGSGRGRGQPSTSISPTLLALSSSPTNNCISQVPKVLTQALPLVLTQVVVEVKVAVVVGRQLLVIYPPHPLPQVVSLIHDLLQALYREPLPPV